MDVGEVRANAEMLARAVATDNRDRISSFLTDSAKEDFFLILDELPRIEDATVADVSSVERDVATVLICLQALKTEFVLRTIWVEGHSDMVIEAVRFLPSLGSSKLSKHSRPTSGVDDGDEVRRSEPRYTRSEESWD